MPAPDCASPNSASCAARHRRLRRRGHPGIAQADVVLAFLASLRPAGLLRWRELRQAPRQQSALITARASPPGFAAPAGRGRSCPATELRVKRLATTATGTEVEMTNASPKTLPEPSQMALADKQVDRGTLVNDTMDLVWRLIGDGAAAEFAVHRSLWRLLTERNALNVPWFETERLELLAELVKRLSTSRDSPLRAGSMARRPPPPCSPISLSSGTKSSGSPA